MKNNRNRQPQRKKKINNDMGLPNPNQWTPTLKITYKQRYFVSANQTAVSINNQELLDTKFVATGATAGYRVINAVKLKRIEIWAANTSASASNTILMEWAGGNPYFGGDSKTISDTAVGTTNVAYISARPPKGSFQDSWITTSADNYNMFIVTCPQGSIIDVELIVSFLDDEGAVAISRTLGGATVGYFYTSTLDSAGAGQIHPLGVQYI
jgi:hypothetical protein